MSEVQIGRMQDAFRALGNVPTVELRDKRFEGEGDNWEQLRDDLRRVWSMARELRLPGINEIENLMPTPEEFVPGTLLFGRSGDETALLSYFQVGVPEGHEYIQPFGERLA